MQGQRQENDQQHHMQSSSSHQADPTREAQEAEGEGGAEGAGEAIHDDEEPQVIQAQNADTI